MVLMVLIVASVLRYGQLLGAVKEASGKAWLKAFKPSHGGLIDFVQKHPNDFRF